MLYFHFSKPCITFYNLLFVYTKSSYVTVKLYKPIGRGCVKYRLAMQGYLWRIQLQYLVMTLNSSTKQIKGHYIIELNFVYAYK